MAKFRYSLQNILNIKEKMETQAKQEFGMAQTALNVEIEHLERLKARKREYEEESGGLLQGKLNLRAIEENKEALLKMDSLVAAQCIRVDKAKENVEAARERMAEAMKESVALGKAPVRLVPLDQLIEMLKKLKLGVVSEPEPAVVDAFFEQYRKSWPSAPVASLPFSTTS